MLVAIGMAAGTMGAGAQETTTTYTSTESAYIDGEQRDANLNGNGLTSLPVTNAQYRDWGSADGSLKMGNNAKVAFYKFPLSEISTKNGTITKATLNITATGTGNCYNIRILGYNADWDATTITFNNISNNGGTIDGKVSSTGSFQPLDLDLEDKNLSTGGNFPTTFEVNVLDYLRSALESDKDYVSFAVSMNLTRTLDVNNSATLNVTTTTVARTNYVIRFQDKNGVQLKEDATYECNLGDEVTASTTDMEDFFSADGTKKYTYESGNKTITTTDNDENVITLVFKELPQFTVTINAVDKEGNILVENISKNSGFQGDEVIAYWHKYINVNGRWYVTETKKTEPFLGIIATETKTENVIYEPSNIDYFIETEDMHTSNSTAWAAATDVPKRFSNGQGYRLGGNRYAYTDPLEGGTYKLTIFSRHTKEDAQSLSLYVRSEDGILTDLNIDYVTTSGTSEHYAGEVTIPDGYSLVINKDNKNNSNVVMDYLYLTNTRETASITSAGWATLYSDKALDFTGTGVKAYIGTVNGSSLTLTEVTTVPAETAVIIEGEEGPYDIPVIEGSETNVAANVLKGTPEEITLTNDTEYDYYAMKVLSNGNVGFALVADGGTVIPAGKAYLQLHATTEAAKVQFFSLGGETTGIEAVETQAKEDGKYYNLMGVEVENPQKGIYIKNGKKIVIK